MKHLIALLFLLVQLITATASHATGATPDDVYAEAVRIEQEVETLKHFLKVPGDTPVETMTGDLKPRHVWAKSYTLLLKLGKLRRKLGLSYIEPVGIEPLLDMAPTQPWSMTQRILTEIAILRFHLDIPGQAPAAMPVTGKRPIDVYNKLNHISGDLDLLAGAVTPSEVYGEVMRINEDIDEILLYQHRFEHAVPPARQENLQPRDSLHAAFKVIDRIQQIQRAQGLSTMDYQGFDAGDKTTPDDVYGMVAHALLELQRVKAQLGMTHSITPGASFQENKTPSDVVQLLGYIAEKLQVIQAK